MSARVAVWAAALAAALAGCSGGQGEAAGEPVSMTEAGMQSEEEIAAAAAGLDGRALFAERCGMCHQTIGMAVGILSRRPGDASGGLLEQREDLSATFVRTAVRTGILNMPRMPRAEVSDAELAAIANYLSRGKP
ncbi:MAG: cytochrome c [Pseudomonadota bacterium]|jgi:mono/diheme cytochrome c family protein|nr:MAG: cytochrome C [Pseudomonadota bacterium]